MNFAYGDLIQSALNGEFDVIAHGCNCMCTMGAGIARQIKINFPEAYEEDQKTVKGDISKLGHCQYVHIPNKNITVVNAYTQYDYSSVRKVIDYNALARCLYDIKINSIGKYIGLPKIGCGLAGGNWDVVKAMIENIFYGEHVTVMCLPNERF